MEIILGYLSTKVMDVIASGYRLDHLYYLLEYLAVWEKRPGYLTPIAFQWCSAITEVAIKFGGGEMPATPQRIPWDKLEFALRQGLRESGSGLRSYDPGLRFIYGLSGGLEGLGFQDGLGFELRMRLRNRLEHRLELGLGPGVGVGLAFQLRQQGVAPSSGPEPLSSFLEGEFSQVGPGCNITPLDHNSDYIREHLHRQTPHDCTLLLPVTLEIGFRLTAPSHDQSAPDPKHTPHHEQMFKIAFMSGDDEVIADATWAWIAGGACGPPSSFAGHLNERAGRNEPFSPRLRRACICCIEYTWLGELEEPGLETVRLLNRLSVDVDDVAQGHEWEMLLVGIIRSPTGLENLSSHSWHLLNKLALARAEEMDFASRDMEVIGFLERAEDREKLEDWMVSVWLSDVPDWSMQDVRRATINLLSQRPSALPGFEVVCATMPAWMGVNGLRDICKQEKTDRSVSEALPPYVPVRSFASHRCVLTFVCLCFSQPTDLAPLPSPGDELLRSFIVYTTG